MAYKVMITTQTGQIEKKIKDLIELEELLLQYKEYTKVKVDNLEKTIGGKHEK